MRQQSNLPRLTPIAAMLLATGAAMGTAQAQQTPPQTDPVSVPALTGWNTDNTLTVNGTSEDGQTFIFPDAATAGGASDGTGSFAYVSWSLDVGGGEQPGIHVVSDDDNFKVNNCIMASGKATDEDTGEVLATDKICSDYQGSSKRYKLVITEAFDAGAGVNGVDLVFNTGVKDMTYDADIETLDGNAGITAGVDANGDGLIDDTDDTDVEVGRIYRVIQKLINDTDQRIENIRVVLGTDTGDSFTAITDDASISVDDIGFEVRPVVAETFFGDLALDQDDNPDPSSTKEVWSASEFAALSPSMYYVGDDQNDPDFRFGEGFFDTAFAGLPAEEWTATAAEKTDSIDSGATVDPSGKIGSITDNYFDLPAYRTLNTLPIEDGPIPGTVFGYLLPESQLPTGIYEDLDGDPASEGDLIAWWDGENWRYGQDQDFAIVPDSQLADWAARPLSEDEVLPGPRYEAAVIDDLRAVNMDFFIYLGENAVTSEADGFDPASITV
ncbi:choice-of-anchor F family protein, partial [Thioalkalivibrio sp.]|uniref:choice-of-anchor F family protein n=1 Tax=Thioalkalivibrio sp. TaxID=2093813 RepID=UPI003976E322